MVVAMTLKSARPMAVLGVALSICACNAGGLNKPDSSGDSGAKDSDTPDDTDTAPEDSDTAPDDTGRETGPGDTGGDSETSEDSGFDTAAPLDVVLDEGAGKLIGEEPGDAEGGGARTLAVAAGDLDGDGSPDVVVGMPANSRGGEAAGSVYVVAAPGSGITDLSLAGGIIEGLAGENFGYATALGGDVNGDGYEDVLVGAPAFREGTGSYEGQAYLFFGPVVGETTTALAAATLHGEVLNEYGDESLTGAAIASAGDVNGDGYDDVLVGAWGYNYAHGAAYLLLGPVEESIELSSVAWRLMGPDDGSSAVGTSVSGAGDMDGDGLDDVVISAPGYGGVAALLFTDIDPTATPTIGDASATFTSASGDELAGWVSRGGTDVNGDGYADVLVSDVEAVGDGTYLGAVSVVYGPTFGTVDLSTLSPRIIGASSSDGFSSDFASVGDMDGDGIADVVVGAPDQWRRGAGAAYLFSGPLSGTLETGDAAIRLMGDGDDEAGWAISAAGDMDGDGLGDLLVGAPGDDDGGANAGAVWLVTSSLLF